MSSDLAARIARIREASGDFDVPGWVSAGPPPNPRGPSDDDRLEDLFAVWAERDAARTEAAGCRHRIEALTTLCGRLHDECGCTGDPCTHLRLLEDLAL